VNWQYEVLLAGVLDDAGGGAVELVVGELEPLAVGRPPLLPPIP
jgi:hypothetical protein